MRRGRTARGTAQEELRVRSIGYAFQIEMTWWAVQRGFRIAEVPITFHGRDHGETKFSKSIVWEAVWTVWQLRLGLIRNDRPRIDRDPTAGSTDGASG